MPTPLYTLRLPAETQENIAELSVIYGASNPRAFAREILEVITSGDVEKLKAFNARLVHGMGQQLTLRFNSTLDALKSAEKPALKAKTKTAKGKEPDCRGKRLKP
jgi:hypothetical protein